MGVAGSGKTTVGKLLSESLQAPFYDADKFHPVENVEKMRQGLALDDNDRKSWLQEIHTFVSGKLKQSSLVFACSALKEKYRKQLSVDLQARWVYLEGSFDDIERRMKSREGHYMPASLLTSQFAALEPPTDAIIVSINQSPENMVAQIMQVIEKQSG